MTCDVRKCAITDQNIAHVVGPCDCLRGEEREAAHHAHQRLHVRAPHVVEFLVSACFITSHKQLQQVRSSSPGQELREVEQGGKGNARVASDQLVQLLNTLIDARKEVMQQAERSSSAHGPRTAAIRF